MDFPVTKSSSTAGEQRKGSFTSERDDGSAADGYALNFNHSRHSRDDMPNYAVG